MADRPSPPDTASDAPRATVRAPEFPTGLDWLHTDGRAVTLADLRGRVALLDFWTFGCINCLHLLPQLRALERRFGRALLVIGVHSGKFIAERDTARLAAACARLGIAHPVLNDRQFRAWRAWAVRGWPSLALVDARGYVAAQWTGERRADALAPEVARLVARAEAEGTLDLAPRWLDAAHDAAATALALDEARATRAADAGAPPALRFPAGVAVGPRDAAGRRALAVADTGHHRLLLGTLSADGTRLEGTRVVGSGTATSARHGPAAGDATRGALAERADGPAATATFDAPRGLAFGTEETEGSGGAAAGAWDAAATAARAVLWVADAGNHALRAVDLVTGAVRTAAGTGARAMSAAERAGGALASPWDVAVVGRGGAARLVVAMAGTHQLHAADPRTVLATGALRAIAGGRGEALLDGAPAEALLAQPMALATAAGDANAAVARRNGAPPDGTAAHEAAAHEAAAHEAAPDDASAGVWFADAETSAVRVLARPAAVHTLVGTGLFDFGDVDGAGDAVRLQHPEGLARLDDGRLVVADTYNDALKLLDPATRAVTTWVRGLREPRGLAAADGRVWVAESGAHRVVVVDVATGAVTPLAIAPPAP